MKPVIKDATVLKFQDVMGGPITKGFDQKLNACLDELEDLRKKQNGKPQVMTCDRMEELTNG